MELELTSDTADRPTEVIEEDRKGFELVHGQWVEKGMGTQAAVVGNNLAAVLSPFVRQHRLGHVMNSDASYRLFPTDPKLVRKPDLSFVAQGRFPNNKPPSGNAHLAPDLAVEVVSPNDLAEGVEIKLGEYQRAGVRLIWVVYVPTQSVWAYRPDGTAKRYTAADTVPGEDVLPGFAVPVAELFEGV